jgi:hypothetical protein
MDRSPLLALSAELRNTIAEMALYHEHGVVIGDKKDKTPQSSAFTQTCREMRKDYNELYYSINTFKLVTNNHGFVYEIARYAHAIGFRNVAASGSITVVLPIHSNTGSSTIRSAIQELTTGGNNRSLSTRPILPIKELLLELELGDGGRLYEVPINPEIPQKSLKVAREKMLREITTKFGLVLTGSRFDLKVELWTMYEVCKVLLGAEL